MAVRVDLWEAVVHFLSDGFKGGAFPRVVRIPVETSSRIETARGI